MEFIMSRYLVARYIRDLTRMEPRNIGVFLFADDGRVLARFLGERNGALDLRVVRSQVTHTQAYRQWIEYWRFLMRERPGNDQLAEQILASSKGNYQVGEGDMVFLPVEIAQDPHSLLEHLFQLLVTEFPNEVEQAEDVVTLAARCEEIIQEFKLRETPHWAEAPVVPVRIGGAAQHFRPSYAWRNGQEIFFQRVAINSGRLERTQKDVTSAAYLFEKLRLDRPASQTKALVKMADMTPQMLDDQVLDPNEYLTLLSRTSDVVDIDDARQVDRTFGALV
jgi:hypothetical protein